MKLYIYGALLVVLLSLGLYGAYRVYEWGKSSGDKEVAALKAADAAQIASQAASAKAKEQAQAASTAAAERQMLQDFQNDKDKQAAVISQLRAGSLRLRHEWTCPAVPTAAANTGKPDGDAKLREQDASDLVRNAADADAQVRALQSILKSERQ